MAGKQSRARRLAAVQRARLDVYASNGDTQTNYPFDNERQNRIYEQSYNYWRRHYWRMERLFEEMSAAYGHYEERR